LASVKFDGTELRNATYVPRFVKHDAAPLRELEILELARDDGGILVSERYQPKIIMVQGVLKASTRALLDQAIDEFKELISRKEKNLDISYRGGTRRYVVYARSHNLDRDFYHNLYVPYEIEFVVPASIGKDTSQTAARDSCNVTTTYDASVTLGGSAKPKPTVTLLFGTGWTNAVGISFEQTDLDEMIIINYGDGFSNADVLVIDVENKKVTLNDAEIEFYRVIPSFVIGENKYQIKAGDLLDQMFDTSSDPATVFNISATVYVAQSFTVPHTDETYQGVRLYIRRDSGGSAANLTVEIQTDSGGEPSGAAVTNATFEITDSDVGTSNGWILAHSTNRFTLSANTRYWIVVHTKNDSANRIYYLPYLADAEATYGRGNAAGSPDSGANWTDRPARDCGFQLLFGGRVDSPPGVLTLDIDYYKRWL